MDELLKKVVHQHADIPTISPLEIKEIEKDENQKLWLVDVRTPEEMKVSMIKGSISKAKFEEAPPGPSDPKNVLVPYCTVGGRYDGWLLLLFSRCVTLSPVIIVHVSSQSIVAFV